MTLRDAIRHRPLGLLLFLLYGAARALGIVLAMAAGAVCRLFGGGKRRR